MAHITPIEWLMGDDTGISSQTILSVMTGSKEGKRFYPDVPHDNGDFGRCYRLLKLFPAWRPRLPEVSNRFPWWGPMVAAWDELTAMYEDGSDSPRLYERIKELEQQVRAFDSVQH